MKIDGYTPEEDRMLGYNDKQEIVDLMDYSEWRWVPTPPSSKMVKAALAHQGNVAEMLKAAWAAAPKPWLED